MVELPIACTLTHEELAKVKEAYKASQHLYRATAHIATGAAVVDLTGDKGPLGLFLRSMVAREEKCCAFLTFALSETEAGFRLRLGSNGLEAAVLRILVEMLFPSAAVAVQDAADQPDPYSGFRSR